MPKRTTLVLDDDVYKKLIDESIRKYGTARAVSRVINKLVEDSIPSNHEDMLKLLYSKKVAKTTAKEFENFRAKLSSRLEA